MNIMSNIWYWKKFYWKMFSTFITTGGAAITVGLAGTNWGDMTTTQHWIFVIGVVVVIVKAQDSLVDQTWQQLSSNDNGQKPTSISDGIANGSTVPTIPKQ